VGLGVALARHDDEGWCNVAKFVFEVRDGDEQWLRDLLHDVCMRSAGRDVAVINDVLRSLTPLDVVGDLPRRAEIAPAPPPAAPALDARTWLAGQALAGMLSGDMSYAMFQNFDRTRIDYDGFARHSVRYTDALLAELAKEKAND